MKTIKIVPEEDMFHQGRKVLHIVCEESTSDATKRINRLKEIGYSNKKPVKRVSGSGAVKFYDSLNEAAEDSGKISCSSVSKCLNKKQSTAGGYSFFYI